MVDVQPTSAQTIQPAVPETGKDRRNLIPELGLKEYCYPAIEARKVRNKPVGLIIMKEQIVFFRDKDSLVKALWNVCPHRGGSLMHGDCHFEGTISCPYYGWTFDGDGKVLPTTKAEEASRLVQTEVGMTPEWKPGDEDV